MGPSDAAMTPAGKIRRDDSDDAATVVKRAAKVRVQVIGDCEILVGTTRVRPDAAMLFGLLLYVTSRAGERIPRSEILEMFWPGSPETPRRHALRQLTYRLRKLGLDFGEEGELRIDSDVVDSDLNRMRGKEWIDTSPIGEIPHPSAVFASYAASISPGFSEWLESTRQELNRGIRGAALRHIAKARREGRWVDVERLARTCLASDPLNEEATLALAEATAMSGSKAEALRILDAYLWDLGDRAKEIGLPAKLLRSRISDQPQSRIPRSGDIALIGRSAELSWLNDRLEAASAGAEKAALVIGAPGIGKTALARAFASQITMRGWRTAESRLHPSDVSRPMSLFVELLPLLLKMQGAIGATPESLAVLKQVVQHDGSSEPSASQLQDAVAFPARIRLALVDLVASIAAEGPLVLVLEDLHWIDSVSRQTLEWLVERVGDADAFVLMTSRPEGQLPVLREAVPRERAPDLELRPLSREDSLTLVDALSVSLPATAGRLREDAYSLTGGNPLFIRSLAGQWSDAAAASGIPVSLRETIRIRVESFGSSTQRVLHACAMLGRYASANRVSAVLEMPTAELLVAVEELDTLGLLGLSEDPGSLALHDLWQEELLAGLRPASRSMLHLRCGEVLEQEAGVDRSPGVVQEAARHLIAAGGAARATRLLSHAAHNFLAHGFIEAAVETSKAGLSAAPEAGHRARLRLLHVKALVTSGDLRSALEVDPSLTDAIIAGQHPRPPHDQFELLILESAWRCGLGMERLFEAALRCAEEPGADLAHREEGCGLAARMAANLMDELSLVRALRALRSLPSPEGPHSSTRLSATAVVEAEIGSLSEASQVAERLVRLERSQTSVIGLIRALRIAAQVARAAGPREVFRTHAEEGFEIAHKHQLHELAAQFASMLMSEGIELRDLDRSVYWNRLADLEVQNTSVEYLRRTVQTGSAWISLLRGDFPRAGALLAQLEAEVTRATARDEPEILSLGIEYARATSASAQLAAYVKSLGLVLERSRERIRQDQFVRAYTRGLDALGRDAEAADYRRLYATQWRRDRSPSPSMA